MYPPNFEYYVPSTVEEAVGLLDQHQGDAKILAGGQSLIAMMKLRLAQPAILVDINRIPNLAYVREDDKFLRIGATTRTAELSRSTIVQARYPILSDAGREIADPIVRNRGTVGGNVSHGDPGNDLPACLLAMGAEFEIHGPKGIRTLPARGFYQDTFVTSVATNEMMTEIRVPRPGAGTGSAYSKMERKVGDFATVGVGARVVVDSSGKILNAGIGLTNVGPTAIYATAASDFLAGKTDSDAVLAQAAVLARDASAPSPDNRGPVDFKKDMVRIWTRRTLRKALDRAKGGK
ncbi:MAG: xanthine dehydrogenase family protein subunit M [Thermoplasmata archaeon]|jgi:carbon-monoxide dehydrogenase medium subunit|nr:xanthine dehydrogenase family protein subunit M [Thermoplasmata archaeon]